MRTPWLIRERRGFTLIELLTVIGVIALLAAMLLPAVYRARLKAAESACLSNLHQISLALTMYQDEHDGRSPDWLSSLYPDYLNSEDIFVCKEDDSLGEEGSKPDGVGEIGKQYEETDDTSANNHGSRNDAIERCSYLYEWCAARCSWYYSDGGPAYLNTTDDVLDRNDDVIVSWGEVKEYQLRHGDTSSASAQTPYSESRFPIVRCFHHWHNRKLPAVKRSAQTGEVTGTGAEWLTLNVAYAGNVFEAPLYWEEAVE